MAGPGGLGDLDSRDWKDLQEIADNLEAAWRKGEAVDLARFLPPPGVAARPTVLQELIKTDLECRWRRGQAVVLDYYLEKFPDDLGTIHSISPTLVYEEFRVRQLFGDRPPLEQYQARFPKQFGEVQELVQQHSVKTNVPQHTPPPGKRDSQDLVKTNIPQPPLPAVPSGSAASASFGKNVVVPQIGGVALIERIGTGSFAEVWKAKAPGGIFKALKIIIRPIDQEECQREVESMEHIKNLRHHFLLPIHQFWALEDRLMIMMDLADGSLRDCLNKHRKEGRKCVPLPDLLRYFRQASEALDYLHSKKVQHRDIKPENILLVEDNVRVADFGLAKVQATTRMVTGTFAGTPLYMPPETWNDKSHPNGDQYSLAATYFELRAGRRLYKDGGLPSLMQAHLLETPNLEPLEEAEQKVMLRALAKNPDDRYPSCLAWFQDLEKAVTPSPPAAPCPVSPGETLSDEPLNTLQPGQARPASWHRPESHAELGALPSQASVAREPSWAGRLLTFTAVAGLAAAMAWIVFGNRAVEGEFTLKPPRPAEICAGEFDTVRIVIKRDNFTEPVLLKFADDPDVAIEAEPIASDATSVAAKLTIADAAPAGDRNIKYEAIAGDKSLPGEIKLTIKPLATLPRAAPAGPFRPAGREIVTCPSAGMAKKFYKHIECAIGAIAPKFVFVPRPGRPFYIMVDKVSNDLFAAFAQQHPDKLVGSRWQLGARREENSDADFFWTPDILAWSANMATQPRAPHLPYPLAFDDPFLLPHPLDLGVRDSSLPVFRVGVVEAQAFAEWLNGALPSAEQWDKAAGKDEPQRGAGPFLEEWQEGEIAVKRGPLGPMPVGAAQKDRSLFGCHDMAGNGLEWTRTYLADAPGEFRGDAAKVPHQARMLLRGRDYAHVAPLMFDENAGWSVTFPFFEQVRNALQRSLPPHIGFRIVVEVD